MHRVMKPSGVDWIGDVPAGWEVGRLKDCIFTIAGSGLIKNSCNYEPAEGLVPGFSASGQDVWVTSADFDRPGIVLSSVGARCGKCFLADLNVWSTIANTQAIFSKSTNKFSNKYFWYLLNDEDMWERAGTAQPFISTNKTLQKAIAIPSLAEQIAIANYLDEVTAAIDEQKDLLDKKKELLLDQKKALIHQAVTKRLDPSAPMKPSGVDWIGEIPVGWDVKRIKDAVAKLESGSREVSSVDTAYFSVGGEHIQNGKFNLDKHVSVSPNFFNSARSGKISVGDILMVKDGATVGKSMFVKSMPFKNMLLNEHVFSLRARYSAAFLYFWISQSEILLQIQDRSQKSAQPGLNRPALLTLDIVLPSLEEQIAIANYLDESTAAIDEQCELIEKKINLLTEMRASVIHETVTKGMSRR